MAEIKKCDVHNYDKIMYITRKEKPMPTCLPISDLRDTAAFCDLVEKSDEPVTVTKNGYTQFVCLRNEDYLELEQARARERLMERIMLAERERAAGITTDLLADIEELEAKYGL